MNIAKFAYLQLINEDGNNRYYRMRQDGNIIVIEMGRNGATPVIQKKPLSLWDMIYSKKINEGYVDTAEVHAPITKKTSNNNYDVILDDEVRALFDALMGYANKALQTSYKVSWDEVTPEMITTAQNIIKELDEASTVENCKKLLLLLFAIVPRKMKEVKDYLPTSLDDMGDILAREQELLDVLTSKISQEKKAEEVSSGKTILDALGLKARVCTPEEEAQIKKFMGSESAPRFKRAFRINNEKTDARFYEYMEKNGLTDKDVSYLYHGSKNQNYYGLISEGPLLNPNAPITGKMFGYGLYYSNRARKSINYTSIKGSHWAKGTSSQAFLAVYKVCYKNPKHVLHWSNEMTKYTAKKIAPYDAVFAHGGADLINDEIIVYNEAQCTLQYIIELK